MPITESILAIVGTVAGIGSVTKDLAEFINANVKIEDVLTQLVDESFQQRLPRLRHLCLGGEPRFDPEKFRRALGTEEIRIQTVEDLQPQLLPILKKCVVAPEAIYEVEDFIPVYESVLSSALRGMWKKISRYESLAEGVLLGQCEMVLKKQTTQAKEMGQGFATLGEAVSDMDARVQGLETQLRALAKFASSLWQQVYDKLADVAPPSEHKIGEKSYQNPFLLVRAEDFNHNYPKLARLFQDTPEWDSIQSRTDNVFMEGGRGTGKSMFLRRLTAQATLAAKRLQDPNATFDEASVDYFGVYVKLTRGYYDQFDSIETVNKGAGSILAQHQLNIEIFDAFVDTLLWLVNEHGLPNLIGHLDSVTEELGSLFPRAPEVHSLDDLQRVVVRFEQEQITTYYREGAFGRDASYQGSACETVGFLRKLSQVFRRRLFPTREIRLFLLIDEFETLVEIQQVALNTVMKMRLPDLTSKIAVRKAGRKTADTFTQGDPIQQPRDYIEIPLDYDVNVAEYSKLLVGIAAKRLEYVRYPDTDIRQYLPEHDPEQEVPREQLESELRIIWDSGQRRKEEIDPEFRTNYELAATYRCLAKTGRRKYYCGFKQYVFLSSGITSNFIELCKYAFYFALSDQLPLREQPQIPWFLQTEAVYRVSQRLLATIDGNVPIVGSTLARLLVDIGSILRQRLLNHPSEPEANRLAVPDFDDLSHQRYSLLAEVIDGAIVWSVLHLEAPGQAFRPKRAVRPPNAELIINRIYCPALEISPRARWRVYVKLQELMGLVDSNLHDKTFQRLTRLLGSASGDSQAGLFEKRGVD